MGSAVRGFESHCPARGMAERQGSGQFESVSPVFSSWRFYRDVAKVTDTSEVAGSNPAAPGRVCGLTPLPNVLVPVVLRRVLDDAWVVDGRLPGQRRVVCTLDRTAPVPVAFGAGCCAPKPGPQVGRVKPQNQGPSGNSSCRFRSWLCTQGGVPLAWAPGALPNDLPKNHTEHTGCCGDRALKPGRPVP